MKFCRVTSSFNNCDIRSFYIVAPQQSLLLIPFLGGGATYELYIQRLCVGMKKEIGAYLNAVQNENKINDNISNSQRKWTEVCE